MIPDPTDEIRAIRNRLAAKCNYDLDRIVEETRQHQRDSGRTYDSLGQVRRPEEVAEVRTGEVETGAQSGCYSPAR